MFAFVVEPEESMFDQADRHFETQTSTKTIDRLKAYRENGVLTNPDQIKLEAFLEKGYTVEQIENNEHHGPVHNGSELTTQKDKTP
jgi:hypothetical protein